MRKIILSMMVSVDGYIESRDPNEYWTTWDEEMGSYMMDFFGTVDTFIYGRKSYEAMIAYWPPLSDPFAVIMNETPKFVFSRTLKKAKWNSTVLGEEGIDVMRRQKQESGKDLVLFAGADLAETFIAQDLIDEYRLIVNPIALAEGKPLFRRRVKLARKEVRPFDCGNTLLVYEPFR